MGKLIIEKIQNSFASYNGDGVGSCLVWELSKYFDRISQIDCHRDFTLLTTMEADAALIDWFKVLDIGGRISLIVPDSNYYAQMWMDADWNENTLKDGSSQARRSFAGLFGNQETGNPKFNNYSAMYSDVNKSAYNRKRLAFLLERVGFVEVAIYSDDGNLHASAMKSMHKGERQIATDYAAIRMDHKNRYQFACEQLKEIRSNSILDLACGIGYGTLMLAKATGAQVIGVDIDAGAIQYAKNYYNNSNTRFICEDARKIAIADNSIDAVVSFETIEHVEFDQALLNKFYQILKPGGTLICSTPNEDVMPFRKESFKFHVRHYRVSEILEEVKSCGFYIEEIYTQMDPQKGEIVQGEEGCFTILVCRK